MSQSSQCPSSEKAGRPFGADKHCRAADTFPSFFLGPVDTVSPHQWNYKNIAATETLLALWDSCGIPLSIPSTSCMFTQVSYMQAIHKLEVPTAGMVNTVHLVSMYLMWGMIQRLKQGSEGRSVKRDAHHVHIGMTIQKNSSLFYIQIRVMISERSDYGWNRQKG